MSRIGDANSADAGNSGTGGNSGQANLSGTAQQVTQNLRDLGSQVRDVAKERYLVDCSEGPDEDTGPLDCDWWSTPPRPGSAAAVNNRAAFARAARRFAETARAQRLRSRMTDLISGG